MADEKITLSSSQSAGLINGGTGLVFDLDDGGFSSCFVIRYRDQLYAYVNSCPHQGHPLDLVEGRFFDAQGRFLMCSSHGAQFDPRNGLCLAGPCAALSLCPVEVCEQ